VNRIQNMRKESGFDVTDKITVLIEDHNLIREAINRHSAYIGSQTLATMVAVVSDFTDGDFWDVEIDDVTVRVSVCKVG